MNERKDYHNSHHKKIINITVNNAINESSYDYIKQKLDIILLYH